MQEIVVTHGGTMCFWGDWFGRPMDNYHTVVKAIYLESTDALVITFDNQEECTVYSPVDITSTDNSFFVIDAKAVTWSWLHYGREPTQENRFIIRYTKEDGNVVLVQRETFGRTQ